jgi:hypothetical protein
VNEHSNACWVHIFKKERDNERHEVELAIERARKFIEATKEDK